MTLNLRTIKTVETAAIEIRDPADGTPLGVIFTLAGPTHPDRKRIAFAKARKALRAYEKRGKIDMLDPEEAEESKIDDLAAYTLGWTGPAPDNGGLGPFSPAAALALYRDPTMAWLVEQVDTAIGDRELFIRRAASS